MQTETPISIPFYDADAMGVVWHGNYAKYLELARCDFLDGIGYNYDEMSQSGYLWPIVDMRIKYVKPLVFKQKIVVTTSIAEWEYRLKLNYLITDSTSHEKLCKAYTIQVAVDIQTQQMCFQSPKELTNIFENRQNNA